MCGLSCLLIFLLQEPKPISLGTHMKWKGVGENRSCKRVEEKMLYIPILDTLKQMLEDREVMAEVSILPIHCQLYF